MAKNREQLEAELKELDSKIVVKEDHNNSDLEAFIELEQLRVLQAAPAVSLEADLELIHSLKEEVAELNEALADAETTAAKGVSLPTGTVGKDTYEVVYPKLNYNGAVLTAQDVAEDKKILTELVKSGSAAVRKV